MTGVSSRGSGSTRPLVLGLVWLLIVQNVGGQLKPSPCWRLTAASATSRMSQFDVMERPRRAVASSDQETPKQETEGDLMSDMTDEEIVRAVRGMAAMQAEREKLAEQVSALRTAVSAEDLAERNRFGEAMAKMDTKILLESIEVLGRMGMTLASQACYAVAREDRAARPLRQ